jgi:hypothetical protein
MRLLLVFAFADLLASACSCLVTPGGTPPCQAVGTGGPVFKGIVTDIIEPGLSPPLIPISFPSRRVHFALREVFQGLEPSLKELTVETGLGRAVAGMGLYVVASTWYMLHVVAKEGISPVSVPVHARFADADEDLAYFRHLADAPPVAEIRVFAYDSGRIAQPKLAGLPDVRVAINGSDQQSGVTNVDGRITFSGLPPERYFLRPR